jgi:hypothetical protein
MNLYTLATAVSRGARPISAAKITIPAGETVAVYRIAGDKIKVELAPSSTGQVFVSMEDDEATLLAADHTAPFLVPWPAGVVATRTQMTHDAPVGAIVAHAIGGDAVLSVRC